MRVLVRRFLHRNRRIRRWSNRAVNAALRHAGTVHALGAVEFSDLRSVIGDERPEMRERVALAVRYVALGGPSLLETFESEIRLIMAGVEGRDVSVSTRDGEEWTAVRGLTTDPKYLASQLVWIAVYMRAADPACPQSDLGCDPRARRRAYDRQLEFLEGLAEPERHVERFKVIRAWDPALRDGAPEDCRWIYA